MATTAFPLGLDSFGEDATDADRTPSDAETVRLIVEGVIETWWQHWQPPAAQLAEERGFCKPTGER
ncbi:hypothetical protein ACW4TU_09370 [Streptomyces sp. QTS52]